MMKDYIFYSTDGVTKDKNLNETNNCQILGWSSGANPKEALNTLKKEINLKNIDDIRCQELKSEKVFYL